MRGLDFDASGLCRVVGAPAFGRQDRGHAPGGPADRFGMWAGNALLGQDRHAPALEIVHLPEVRFTDPALFVISGAPRKRPRLGGAASGAAIEVEHGVVYAARAGDRLVLGPPEQGLRTYLCVDDEHRPDRAGRRRPAFDDICRTADPGGAIRVIPGPEHGWLASPGAVWDRAWRLTREMSDVGLRIVPADEAVPVPAADPPEITSGPVADGTVQLTPAGLVVLLRQRPTLGGYPRIATVSDVDIDRLAQYQPGQTLRFRAVSADEAAALYRQREQDLADLGEGLGLLG